MDKETVDLINGFLVAFIVLACVFLLPLVTAGSLLPTWMFINSLQIIAHMTLIKTLMPANVHYFLRKYLDLLRWHDSDFIEHLDNTYDFKKYVVGTGAYSTILGACDYSALFAQNIVIVLIVLGILLVFLFVFVIKDALFALGKCLGWQNTRVGQSKLGKHFAEKKYSP